MYHCHMQFCLAGIRNNVFEKIKETAPMENFVHEFSESETLQAELIASADVIFANLSDLDITAALEQLIANKKEETELIILASPEQFPLLSNYLCHIKDIWNMPMSDDEAAFRFLHWQQACKMAKDYWQTDQYLESTINNIPDLIWYKDKEGIHKKVNDSFCKTVNKTKQQVEGRTHAYIWDVDYDDPACIESEQEVMTKKRTCIAEETIKTGKGERLLTTYKSPLYDLDGSVMGTVGVAIDITQERTYELEIISKNRTLEAIFTKMDCGVLSHSVDGTHIININKAALNILGYESQEELIRDGFHTVAPSVLEEDKDKIRNGIATLHKEGDSVGVEYRVCHKDGKIIHVMGNIKLMQENGKLFYQRFLLDCTKQKLQEQEKQVEYERRQMELIQALSIDYNLVYFFNLHTGLGFPLRNNNSENLTFDSNFHGKMSLDDSMTYYIKEYVLDEDQEMVKKAVSSKNIKKALSEKDLYFINYRTNSKDGLKYYQMKIVRTGTWDDSLGIVIGIRSVDEEIRNEMEKKSLLEDALMQANRASKAKSVFLSNMSHDIRTPMNAIVGFTTLAISHIENKEQVEEYLRKIESSGNHLLNLINDVLDMSRIESGKMQLDEKPCRLPDILHNLYNILQADVEAKNLTLQIDTENIVHEQIFCDTLRLNQVLLNLLSNSVKYTNSGGSVNIKLIEKPYAPKGCACYEFHIIDTGIGMNDEFLQHIFEPFERERNSTISGIQGTGLGMAITKNIVDMMRGSIEVKSQQGIGTEFTVSLTFRINLEAEKVAFIPEFENNNALVITNDAHTGNNIIHILQSLKIKADLLQTGSDALAAPQTYDIYLIDDILPDISGINLAKQLCGNTGTNAPVMILMAYDWTDSESKAREAGITSFCSKPLFLSELRHCLYSIVHKEDEKKERQQTELPSSQTRRILLAEDVELNQEIAVTILDEAGFCTEVAENGEIAVEMIKNSEPGYYHLVLMDIQMPVMNGYEATKKIRQLENQELASIPILAMSANAFEEDKQESLRCGMNGHIAKPIDIQKLLETLNTIIC